MPTLTIFAGINGAGKSTLYNYQVGICDSQDVFGIRINPDEILKEFGGDWANARDIIKSGLISVRKLNWCLENKESLNWEVTTISSYVMKCITKAKAVGYEINLNFIGVEKVEQALSRVAKRVFEGGHGIPEKVVRRRYEHQYQRLDEALALVDNAMFFENKKTMQIVGAYIDKNLTFVDDKVSWMKTVSEICERSRKLVAQGAESVNELSRNAQR